MGEKCNDLIRWSAVKQLVCSGFEEKNNINTDDYFDHVFHDTSKKKNENEKVPSKLKKKNKSKRKRTCKKSKNLDIDCRICFSHKVHDINPVVYCSKFSFI